MKIKRRKKLKSNIRKTSEVLIQKGILVCCVCGSMVDTKKYIMICHEHMSNTHAWKESLGIVHFFMRQIWVWWAAQQNVIITEYHKKNK